MKPSKAMLAYGAMAIFFSLAGIRFAHADDTDHDGVVNVTDNCTATVNSDQIDNDQDTIGDECDTDDDNDGIADTVDNCMMTANPDQVDTDMDGFGDVCDVMGNDAE